MSYLKIRTILLICALVLLAAALPTQAAAQEAEADTTAVAASAQATQAPAPAPKPNRAGPFSKGRVRIGFYGGAGHTFNQTYVILGGGLGYYLADGLEIGVDLEGWLFQSPTIWKVTPQVRYVFYQMGNLKPYVGAFWRHNIIGNPFDDYSSYGGRFGIAYQSGRSYVALGGVYEKFDENVLGDSDVWYPEIAFWISF